MGMMSFPFPAGYKHFETVQVGSVFDRAKGFVIFPISRDTWFLCLADPSRISPWDLPPRAQKQRMHADYHPVLDQQKCTRCGLCVNICPTKAATISEPNYPCYDLKKCIGCAQCIAMCPELALQIFWNSDMTVFQESLLRQRPPSGRKLRERPSSSTPCLISP